MSLDGDASVYLFENEPINSLEDLYELLDQKYRSSCVDTQPSLSESAATSTSSPLTTATVSGIKDELLPSINAVDADPLPNRKGYADMLRSMPKFKGGPDENFNAWMLNTKSNFATCWKLSLSQKIEAILIKVEGYPRELLDNIGEIQSDEQCFEILKKTYGKDQRFLLANTKQMPDESVKVFASRLKTNLNLLGISSTDSDKSNFVHLGYFLKGLLPHLSSAVEGLVPRNLEDAEFIALQAEVKNTLHQSTDKKNKKVQFSVPTDKINNIDGESNPEMITLLEAFKDNQKNSARSVSDKLSQLTKHIDDKLDSITNKSIANSNGKNGNSPVNNSDRQTYNNNPRRFNAITCFGCNKVGHSFTQCRSTPISEINRIKANFPAILEEYKRKRAASIDATTNPLNSTGVTKNCP